MGAEEYGPESRVTDWRDSWPEPDLEYDPGGCPQVSHRLELLNEMARYDEESGGDVTLHLLFPDRRNPEGETMALMERRRRAAAEAAAEPMELKVVSFDIDLTLALPGDNDEGYGGGRIPPERISELQAMGYVVGTCSDRLPSEQSGLMESLGIRPHFRIPKEMLSLAGELLAGAELTHVGDDDRRDRRIAERAGWKHLCPHEFE